MLPSPYDAPPSVRDAFDRHRHDLEVLIASPYGAQAFVEALGDPSALLARVVCITSSLSNNEDLGEAVRNLINDMLSDRAAELVAIRPLA